MRVLILGGTGAMGEHLVSILSTCNHRVSVTTRSDRKSSNPNICYIKGNAHDLPFIRSLLSKEHFDAIVDFMHYSTAEFTERYSYLLNNTEHYLYLSSARVYAESQEPITEDSPRLLDACKDEAYLSTDDYALAKAKQENLLLLSGKKNFTIIRPYMTFSEQRLQLGVFEKEDWLIRAIHGKPIVFSKDIAKHYTTLTYGYDVSTAIAGLVGNDKAKGETFHIATDQNIKWADVAKLYQKVLSDHFKRKVKVVYAEKCYCLDSFASQWAVKYSRYFDYKYDNSKICSILPELKFMDTREGLESCLREFLRHPQFKSINVYSQARMDRESCTFLPLSIWSSNRARLKYLIYRFAPMSIIRRRLRVHK